MLADILQMSLSPYSDWYALRPVLSGDKVIIPDKLILQVCPLVCDEFFHCIVRLDLFCFSGFLLGLLSVVIGKLLLPAVDFLTLLGAKRFLTVGRPKWFSTYLAGLLPEDVAVLFRKALFLSFGLSAGFRTVNIAKCLP